MPEEEGSLAQPGDSMMTRNIGHMASKGKEVQIHVQGVEKPVTGFLAGLDEEYVQVCVTDNQSLANISLTDIVILAETGHTLSDYERENKFKDQQIRAIREKIEHFQRRSSFLFRR